MAAWEAEFGSEFAFAMVYIAEAHAIDEWPVQSARNSPSGQPVSYKQHTSAEERLAAARDFSRDFSVHLVREHHSYPKGTRGIALFVDSMDNAYLEAFSAWPLGVIILASDPEGPAVVKFALQVGLVTSLDPVYSFLRGEILNGKK